MKPHKSEQGMSQPDITPQFQTEKLIKQKTPHSSFPFPLGTHFTTFQTDHRPMTHSKDSWQNTSSVNTQLGIAQRKRFPTLNRARLRDQLIMPSCILNIFAESNFSALTSTFLKTHLNSKTQINLQ